MVHGSKIESCSDNVSTDVLKKYFYKLEICIGYTRNIGLFQHVCFVKLINENGRQSCGKAKWNEFDEILNKTLS